MDNGITMAATVHAYVERRPRVWIELGHSHPLADRLEPPPGQLLLLSPPRNWEFVDECPMQDVYQVLDCCLPHAETAWSAAELVRGCRSRCGLCREAMTRPRCGSSAATCREVDALVEGADDQLLARLAFAVGQRDGQRTIVLRTRPSKQSPPVMVVDGLALQPCLKLPNLFVPCGYRLHPPLRRSTLAQVLASDTSRITWLVPEADGRFAPQSLPDAAFRPLSDYVDYVLDREHESLEAWVAAHRFDFESFVCREDRAVRDEKPPPEKPVASKLPSRPASRPVASGQTQESEEEPIVFTPVEPDGEPAAVQPAAPTDRERLQRRLFEIEQQFLALQSPLDGPDRAALWQEMAQANAALGRHVDAAHCCAAAVWDDDSRLAAILPAWEKVAKDGAVEPLDELQFARLMAVKDLAPERAGAVANFLIWAVASPHSPLSSLFRQRQGPLARFLERNEAVLPARIAWLAWCAMNHLNGDVLALARARDRALERLYATDCGPTSICRASSVASVGATRSNCIWSAPASASSANACWTGSASRFTKRPDPPIRRPDVLLRHGPPGRHCRLPRADGEDRARVGPRLHPQLDLGGVPLPHPPGDGRPVEPRPLAARIDGGARSDGPAGAIQDRQAAADFPHLGAEPAHRRLPYVAAIPRRLHAAGDDAGRHRGS